MDRREVARARARMQAAVREFLTRREFEEVETPCLVPVPAMEPHIDAFCAPWVPGGEGAARPLWLHSSPEYAMKRLLADGFERIFQLARVFRNGEVSDTHNPEFTLLEMYRARTDYRGIMEDLEETVAACARAVTGGTRVAVGGRPLELAPPFERLTAQEAFQTRAGVDLAACDGRADRLRAALREQGFGVARDGDSFDDLYFRVFLEVIEPTLGLERPTYLVDWPAPMAALSRLKPGDPRVAERFELYAGGLELANGFSELTDATEQRRRLVEEQGVRAQLGRPVYPLDERFLAALPRMPEAGGVALGLDRLLMLLVGARTVDEVLLFPAREFLVAR